jgi:hypothetical protein
MIYATKDACHQLNEIAQRIRQPPSPSSLGARITSNNHGILAPSSRVCKCLGPKSASTPNLHGPSNAPSLASTKYKTLPPSNPLPTNLHH